MCSKKLVTAKRQPRGVGLTLQILFAEVWPVIRQMALAGNQDDPARESVFAQSLDCCVSRGAATYNHKHALVLRLALSHRWRAAILRVVRYVDKNLPVLNSRRKTWQRVECRWLFEIAGGDVETSVVPGTDNAFAI